MPRSVRAGGPALRRRAGSPSGSRRPAVLAARQKAHGNRVAAFDVAGRNGIAANPGPIPWPFTARHRSGTWATPQECRCRAVVTARIISRMADSGEPQRRAVSVLPQQMPRQHGGPGTGRAAAWPLGARPGRPAAWSASPRRNHRQALRNVGNKSQVCAIRTPVRIMTGRYRPIAHRVPGHSGHPGA